MEPRIESHELFLRLGDDEVLVLDCREDEAWEALPLHIPGALRISLTELPEVLHILPDDELIVVVGGEPNGFDAQRASRLLRLRGRETVFLQGGITAWVEAGYPVDGHGPFDGPERGSLEVADGG